MSLFLHVNLLGPIGLAAWYYGGREEAQRAEEVDVGFEDASTAELPKDLPPIESPPPEALEPTPAPKPKPEERKKRPLAQEEQKEKEKKKEAEKQKPEPEVVAPPMPPMPPPPPPPPVERKAHEKLVDLDNDKEVEPPPDAKYLAQKNNRADVETRATDTNLEKNQKGESSPSAPSKREDTEVGGEKQKIAELQDQKSALGRSAPEVTPHVNPEVASPKDREAPDRKSLLALRDPAPKTHELTPETADLSLPRAPDGDLAENRAVRGKKSDPSKQPAGKRVKLAITGEDYEYMFGADAEAERRLASKQRSMKQGKHLAKLSHMQSPLENFIPEVKPGNQTALNTRAAPFAAYIARMHRSIHKLWGFGALEDWDELSGSSPFNNPALMTELEIVLNRDGTVDKVGIARSSGYSAYDAAAMDVAYSAGPYPDPPRAIRSGNGKIYVHWRFYRDERQCATSGVDYFILDNGPKGGDDPDSESTAPTPAGPTVGASPASAPAANGPIATAPGGSAGGPAAPGGALAPASAQSPPNTTGNGGLRRLRRFDGNGGGHRAGMARLDQEVAAAEQHDGAASEPAAEPAAAHARAADDPGAHAAAERWFSALAAGDAKTLAAMASLPFKTSGKEVSKRAVLEGMLSDLVHEGEGGGRDVQVFTAGGLRAAIGKLPPNLEDGGGAQLYAIAGSTGARDPLVLILAQRGGLWRPAGLVRR